MSPSNRRDEWTLDTITVLVDGPVLFAEILAPPINLLGPELVRDLVTVLERAEGESAYKVLVFKSGDPDYFISHVDLARVAEYRQEAAKLTGVPSIALLFRHISASRLVTIAQIEGNVRSGGSEFVLSCDMRFAARESAVFAQFESAFGQIPGGGATQYLTRLMGRARALEVLLSGEDYDADLAERYGWINRALPARALSAFVRSLAQRVGGFPAQGIEAIKDRVNAISLAPADEFRRDSDLFAAQVQQPETQRRVREAMRRGLQTRHGEIDFANIVDDLSAEPSC
jgi:enoyl-CoA hydratase/carnithine racemase